MAALVLSDSGKIFDKYLKILYDKGYRKLDIIETHINRLKAVYRKSTATININGEVLIPTFNLNHLSISFNFYFNYSIYLNIYIYKLFKLFKI